MAIEAGVGMSHHRNPKVAGQEAAQVALQAAGIEKPDFCFMFATVGYNQRALVQAVREATGGAPLCGCSGEGVIAGGEADESNFAVGVMAIRSDQLRVSHGIVTGVGTDAAKIGRAIAEAIQPEVSSDTLALFLFPASVFALPGSGLGSVDRLLASLEDQLGLDRLLPVMGGTAADNWALRHSYQYYNDQVVSDGWAWALLSGQAQIAWAVNHGCVPIGIEHRVTRCQGNVIHELDGKPVGEILRSYLTDEEIKDWAKVATTFALGLEAPGYMRGYDQYVIYAIAGGRTDTTGSVAIGTDVSEGTSVWLMRRDYGKLTQGVERAAENIVAQLGEDPARLVFQFDCAGRGKMFLREQQKSQLLERLRRQIGPDVPWLGFYTYGEIAPVGGHNCFHTYTLALAVIH